MKKVIDRTNSALMSFYSKLSGFDEKKGTAKSRWRHYFIAYTALFLIVAGIVFSIFLLYGKTFIWTDSTKDGLTQHYTALAYYGRYLRELIQNFLSGNFALPVYDTSIGYGADIITTLSFYVIGDPLSLLSVFVPVAKTEILYVALIIVRIYLSGIAFSAFCVKMNRGRFGTLMGAICYAFCGYVVYASVRHPYFTNPMIYLPIILIGVEHIFEKRRPYLFIFAIALAAVSNFYFFYMICALVVLYAVIRFFDYYHEKYIKNILINVGKFILYAIMGVGLSAFLLLPNIMAMFSTSRANVKKIFEPFYSKGYYERFLAEFTTPQYNDKWTVLGFSVLAVICVVLLFTMRKKYKSLKIGFVITTIFFLFPIFGYAFNGFSYVSNRWCWGYSLLICFIIATIAPQILETAKRKLYIVAAVTSVICLYTVFFTKAAFQGALISAALLVVAVLCLFGIHSLLKSKNATRYTKFICKSVVATISIFSICVNGIYLYHPNGDNYIEEFADADTAYESIVKESHTAQAKYIEDSSDYYRCDENSFGEIVLKNTSLLNRTHTLGSFFSVSNSNIFQFMLEMGASDYIDSLIDKLDNRTMLDTLASVKYYITANNTSYYKPYGFDTKAAVKKKVENYAVYENKNALGLGYTYDGYISDEDYQNMTEIQRQQALMQGVHLEEASTLVQKVEPEFNDQKLNYTLTSEQSGDVKIENGKITTKKGNAKIKLAFNGVANTETYLSFSNLNFEGTDPLDRYSEKEKENMTKYELKKLKTDSYYYTLPGRSKITCEADNKIRNTTYITNPRFEYYTGKQNYVFTLSYSEQAVNEIEITLERPGIYTFDDLSVYAQPMDNFDAQAQKLGENQLENIEFGTNTVTGDITVDRDKILCITLPYADGWTAYVDGKQVDIKKANTMFMGFELTQGNHQIELKYFTPGLKQGAILSLGFLAIAVLFIIVSEIHRRKKRKA